MTEMMSKTGYSGIRRRLTGLSAVLFSLFILLKPYYLKPSGSIGAADICLAAAGAVMLAAEALRISALMRSVNNENAAAGSKSLYGASDNAGSVLSGSKLISGKLSVGKAGSGKSSLYGLLNVCAGELLYRRDIALYAFIVIAAVVNAIYSIRLGSHEYTKYTVYWIYNGLAIWTLRKLRDADHDRSDEVNCDISVFKSDADKPVSNSPKRCRDAFTKVSSASRYIGKFSYNDIICIMSEIDILLQFAIMLSGHGRYFVEYWGAVRYMGSFNDPNQLAFFMFISMLLIYSLTAGGIGKNNFPGYAVCALAIIIIIKTKSTGIMLGVAVFAFAVWCRWIWMAMQSGRISKKLITAVVIACTVCAVGLLIYIWPPADFDVKNVEYNTLTRIQEKLWKLSQGGIGGFLIDRGGGKLKAFPQYMLFGAGEGGFDRFAIPGQEINEIHCSIMSILFCYGIIPTLFMIKWITNSFKTKNGRQLCACLALIAESMTLINYRQPMFWFLLM